MRLCLTDIANCTRQLTGTGVDSTAALPRETTARIFRITFKEVATGDGTGRMETSTDGMFPIRRYSVLTS